MTILELKDSIEFSSIRDELFVEYAQSKRYYHNL